MAPLGESNLVAEWHCLLRSRLEKFAVFSFFVRCPYVHDALLPIVFVERFLVLPRHGSAQKGLENGKHT
jgi:hypothetical protein